ncbi:HEXXH motif domain-containing protein [Streptomyces sp. NPDC001651]|uniref:HEXXH motif domain-containing protein n=1 Tax=Streptomyces sp. NPDC001651 TaxID=3364596 RepID=UPI0036B3F06B
MRHHQLSPPVFEALASTGEDVSAVEALLDVECSRRLLMLRTILDACASTPMVGEAWELLERAEGLDPKGFRTALLDPQVGLWAAGLMRRLPPMETEGRERAGDEPPVWVEAGFLGQFAAVVAFEAGVDFDIRVPMRRGRVFLPRLGRAHLGSDEPWGTAGVSARGGVLRVAAHGVTVTVPADADTDGPGWEGLRRIRAEHGGQALTLVLDDLGDHRAVPGLATTGRLTATQFTVWQEWFAAMWPLLVDDHPASARALAAGVRSVVPLPRGERLRARAASSSDAFGCVLLSAPDEDAEALPAQLGVALIHEFRHSLLNGLIFLTPLFEDSGELFHAPWRDDPRPIGGLVHGAFAFSGVTRFWHTRGTDGLAGFEFALWRHAVRDVLATLRHRPALTPLGDDLVTALTEQTASWDTDRAGETESRLAELAAAHHHAAWRAHHVRPPAADVDDLMRLWEARRPRDEQIRAERPDDPVHTDPDACRLDVLALLARLSLIDPDSFTRLRAQDDPGAEVAGAGPGDLALVAGDTRHAVKLYADELARPGARPAAWAGLGLALVDSGQKAAGTALVEQPELARALSDALSVPPDPVALAQWLGGA